MSNTSTISDMNLNKSQYTREAMSESSKLFKFKNMFNAYVTHTQMKEYLALLIHNGLLEYQKGKKVYLTTRKG